MWRSMCSFICNRQLLGRLHMGTGRATEVHTGLEADSKRANPATVGTLIGFLLFVCSIQLPESLGRVVEMTGDLTTPLAMILAGLLLAQADLKQIFRAPKVYILSGIRLLERLSLYGDPCIYAAGAGKSG
ncbi:MAG: AEC family transporter [Clostridia bacterium]